jgi:tetratricopeptide (TPR) repeat protein
MRIGIGTGLVVVGVSVVTGQLTAIGDAVNLAKRLEQSAPVGGVLISQETYLIVHGLFDIQPMEPLSVKGRAEPVQTYLVLRPKGRAIAALIRGVAGAPSEMIGRRTELQCLKDALQAVTDQGRLQVVTIVGEAGLGKTCLFLEFQKYFELLPYFVRLFYGRATAEMSNQSFSLLRDMFCARFEIQDSDSAAVARAKLEQGICQLVITNRTMAGLTILEWRCEAAFIGQLIGLDFSAVPEVSALLNDPDQLRHRAFQGLCRFFAAISQTPPSDSLGPVKASLIMAEDLHWSDRASMELIENLAASCANVPLLIVCLARPTLLERTPRWGDRLPNHTLITLEPLSRAESHTMVESILRKTSRVPQALSELIVGKADGIPLFIEQVINMFKDEKVIVPGPNQWVIERGPVDPHVPPTLKGVLQARLDRLTPSERAVLQRASVVGRIFWEEIVEHLSRVEAPGSSTRAAADRHSSEISETLASLRQKELILQRESSAFGDATEYIFKHELLRNVAYEGLLKRARRTYHGQVANWLIERSGERVNEFAGLVAGHFEQAEEKAHAAEWYGRAGQQARNGYAPVTAIELFRKALALLPDSVEDISAAAPAGARARRLEWQEGLGEVLGAQAHFVEALEVYEQLRLMAKQAGDTLAQARALNGMAYMQERLAKNRVSIESAAQAEALARTAGEHGRTELVRALLLKGWAFYRLADAAAVLALAEQTSRLCAEFADRRGLATSFKLYGVAHLQLGDFREADDFFSQGLALYQELGDKRNTAAMFSNLGESARFRGDFSAAAKLYEQALALVRHIGNRDSETIYLSNLCGARLGLSQFKEAEEDIRQAIAMVPAANSCNLADAYTLLSEACLGQQKHQEALTAALKSLALARDSENDLFIGEAWRTLGLVAATIETGLAPGLQSTMVPACTGVDLEPLNAETCFSESLRIFQKINAQGEQARTLRAWGEFQWQKKLPEEARKKLGEAREIFLLLGAASETSRTEALIAKLEKDASPSLLPSSSPAPIEPRLSPPV